MSEPRSTPTRRVGWLCGYVPEELIMAAGLEPVRIRGRAERVKQADSYMYPNFCPYLTNILDSGVRGELADLEGFIFTSSCDAMRRLHDLWTQHVRMPFTHMLEVPKNTDENAVTFFAAQLVQLKTAMEKAFGVNILRGNLEAAIGLMNEHRELVTGLLERQKEVSSGTKGSEILALCLEETASPKDAMTDKLRKAAGKVYEAGRRPHDAPRILVVGSVLDKLDLFHMVERAGGSVVAFDTCTGLRHYSGLVEQGRDLIQSLAKRYLGKPPCPRMPGIDKRMAYMSQIAQDYSVDGVIHSVVKFCDYGLFETPAIEENMKGRQVPVLVLENDYIWSDAGRMGTRIEAFVEMLRGGV